jgi:hypothetical protein
MDKCRKGKKMHYKTRKDQTVQNIHKYMKEENEKQYSGSNTYNENSRREYLEYYEEGSKTVSKNSEVREPFHTPSRKRLEKIPEDILMTFLCVIRKIFEFHRKSRH